MGRGVRRLVLASAAGTAAVGAWIIQACSPTAPQLFAPDVVLPELDSAAPALAFDSGVEPVRVALGSAAGPISGATVVFHDGSGKVTDTATTNGAGYVDRIVPAGSMVSILFGSGATKLQVVTYLGVAPGDVLLAFDSTITPSNTQVNVTGVPGSPPLGTVQYGSLVGDCRNDFTAPPASMGISGYAGSCLSPLARFPMLVVALDQDAGELAFTYQKNIALDFDAGATVDLSDASWSKTHTNLTVAVAGVQQQQYPPNVIMAEVASLVPSKQTQSPTPDGDGGWATQPLVLHGGYADFVQTEIQSSSYGMVGSTFSAVATRIAPPTKDTTLTLDAAQLLPSINQMTYDCTTAKPTVTFTPDSAITNASGTFAVFRWQNSPPDGGSVTSNQWTIIAPPTATTITAPDLPAASSDWTTATSNVGNGGCYTPTVTVMAFDALKSYDDFRRAAAAIPPPDYDNVFVESRVAPLLPLDGTVKLSSVGPFIE